MRLEIILAIVLTLVSCGRKTETEQGIYAGKVSECVRDNWRKSRRPVTVIADNIRSVEEIGVSVIPNEATEGETDAFRDVCFRYSGGRYQSVDINAKTADSTAAVFMCYPCHQGILAHDTIRMTAPFGENLYGMETSRRTGSEITVNATFKSAMTLLSVLLESDDLRDILTSLSIRGEKIVTEAEYLPYYGRWLGGQSGSVIENPDAGCLLNNGRPHHFYLVPTADQGVITLVATINEREYTLNITLPPMSAGAVTRLNIRCDAGKLAVSSSWVETERKPETERRTMPDSICEGYYLQRDGMIQCKKDSLSVAVIIETDGRHGKAVALQDCKGAYRHSNVPISGVKKFRTIDGKFNEGVINPRLTKQKEIEEKIIFTPAMRYGSDCALGFKDGAAITTALLRDIAGKETVHLTDETVMLFQVKHHKGSYIPTLAELAELYHKVNEGHFVSSEFGFSTGMYLTCTESGENTIYAIDMLTGETTGYVSKRHGLLNLRLFYLF